MDSQMSEWLETIVGVELDVQAKLTAESRLELGHFHRNMQSTALCSDGIEQDCCWGLLLSREQYEMKKPELTKNFASRLMLSARGTRCDTFCASRGSVHESRIRVSYPGDAFIEYMSKRMCPRTL